MRHAFLALLLFTATTTFAADDVQVLFVGTYHFANPGLDYVKTDVADVLTDAKQKEVADVVEHLRKFNPTKIAVEWPADKSAALDQRYADYRAGKLAPSRDETVQLGFRLAQLLGHDHLYAIDSKADMDLDAVVAEAQKSDHAFLQTMQQFMDSYVEKQNAMQKEKSIRDILRWMNDPATLAYGHSLYVRMARVGGEGNYVGADVLGGWYARNARIFSNLARAAQPGDRILVLYGQGHVPILQQLARDMPGMKVVAANDFL